jgi:hypothetical protein
MSYKYSKGSQAVGDLKSKEDAQRDTLIDFGEDYIGFETSGSLRMKISGSDGAITFNEAFTFPISDGSTDQVLKTNGNGQLSWTNQSGGGGGSGAISSVANGSDDRIATFSSSDALNGEANLNFDGNTLSQNGLPGYSGVFTKMVFRKDNLTNNTAIDMFNVTVPNGNHAVAIKVFVLASNSTSTRSVAFTHMFTITRTTDSAIGVTFPTGNPSTLTGEATSGGGSPDFSIAGAHTKSGGATEANNFTYTIKINGDTSNGADVVVMAEMLNMNSGGAIMAES